MPDNIETQIRAALDARAHEVEVPETLGSQTLGLAREQAGLSWRGRVRAWRDGRAMRARPRNTSRWVMASGAFATAVLLFVVGLFVTTPNRNVLRLERDAEVQQSAELREADTSRPTEESGDAASGDAVGGSVTGVTSGGDTSVDATNRSEDVDIETGDADGFNDSNEFTGLAPGVGFAEPREQSAKVKPDEVREPETVRSARIQVEVRDFERAWEQAHDIAATHGGFVANSGTEIVGDERARGSLTMRVDAANLQGALADLRELGTLESLRTAGRDVSAVIADVKARVKVLEAEELQLLELMKGTANLAETLDVRRRLDDTRQEIESLKAQQEGYQDQVDFATIRATLFQDGAEPDETNGDRGMLRDAWDTALKIALTIVAGTVVLLGAFLPLAALALGVWLLVRLARKRRA